MREYKFRAWDNEANLMIYSDHRNRELYDDAYYYFETDSKGELKCNWEPEWTDCCQPDGGVFNNLMQYTGFKDDNGVEIYEGDILRIDSGVELYGVYEHTEYIVVSDIEKIWQYRMHCERCVIVGNIYENPELLKEK